MSSCHDKDILNNVMWEAHWVFETQLYLRQHEFKSQLKLLSCSSSHFTFTIVSCPLNVKKKPQKKKQFHKNNNKKRATSARQ